MEIKIELDKRQLGVFNHNLRRMIALSDKPTEQILRDQARLLCKDFAGHTERMGLPKKPTKHATDIARTVYGIYSLHTVTKQLVNGIRKKWGDKAALRLQGYIVGGDEDKANKMLEKAYGKKFEFQKWDKGDAHKRWKQNPRRKQRVRLFPETNKKKIKTYIRKQIKNIGNAKAGWARAAESLGGVKNPTKGIPKWAKDKKHKTVGWGKVTGTGAKTVVTIANESKYGFNRAALRKAYNWRGEQIKKDLDRMIRHNARDISRAQRQGIKAGRAVTKFKF